MPRGRLSKPVRAARRARGPLKVKAEPMVDADPMAARCTATNRQGQRCGQPHIPGGTVCRFHGGAAPQVQAKAMERLLAMQHPALNRLVELIEQKEFPSTAMAAVKDVLDRTLGKPAETVAVDHSGNLKIGRASCRERVSSPV